MNRLNFSPSRISTFLFKAHGSNTFFKMKNTPEIDIKDFYCIQCQACCRQSGYVRLQPEEPDAIAALLGMDVYTFIEKYPRLTRDRQCLSLIEQPDGACIFLDHTGCQIQAAKPAQCKSFPHKWRFSGFETICGWAKTKKEVHYHLQNVGEVRRASGFVQQITKPDVFQSPVSVALVSNKE